MGYVMPENDGERAPEVGPLGDYLATLRAASGLSLREVEQATEKVVSNAYLSQLEKGKVNKPSPNILHALAVVYGTSYEDLMSKAGYFTSEPAHVKAATFSVSNVSQEEQKALLDYLAFLRHQRKR